MWYYQVQNTHIHSYVCTKYMLSYNYDANDFLFILTKQQVTVALSIVI